MALHSEQDLQSLLLHEAAVEMLRADLSLTHRLLKTLDRWDLRNDGNSQPLLDRWRQIVEAADWEVALALTEEAQQLRQASPLPTLLRGEQRLALLKKAKDLIRLGI